MENAALKLGETDRFIAFIDRKLDTLTGQYDRYDRTQLIRSKIFVFEQLGRMLEVENLVTQHLQVFEIRKSAVEECIDQGDYSKAKALIADGIRIAEEQRYPGDVSRWEENLLQIADLVSKMKRIIKDIPAARTAVLGVAQQLKDAYSLKPRRPAMLEELAKLF